jgi:cytochrome c oxidase subunit II
MYPLRLILISFLFLCGSTAVAQTELEGLNEVVTGEELYVACTFCHGVEAQGNDRRDGPALAGLEAWYIEKQIYNYRNGLRAYSDEDIPGKVMHGSTPMIRNDFTIRSISEYIAGLEPGLPMARNAVGARPFTWDSPYAGLDSSITGNAEAGAVTYNSICMVCHGADGSGNEALGAGNLRYLSAIYMERQLMYFRDGIRGAHPDDVTGQQMAAMSKILVGDQAIADVVAYILQL